MLVHKTTGEDSKAVVGVVQTNFITGGTGAFKNIRGLINTTTSTDLKTTTPGARAEGEYYFVE